MKAFFLGVCFVLFKISVEFGSVPVLSAMHGSGVNPRPALSSGHLVILMSIVVAFPRFKVGKRYINAQELTE